MATLRSVLSATQRHVRIPSNPVQGVHLPSVPAHQHTVWTAEQARDFLASCPRNSLRLLFRLAVTTGMRRGELLGLEWSNVDLEAGELVVCASRVAVGGEVVMGSPKSRFGARKIYLDHDTRLALNSWRRTQARCFGPNEGLVFTHVTGEPFQPWWVFDECSRSLESMTAVNDDAFERGLEALLDACAEMATAAMARPASG